MKNISGFELAKINNEKKAIAMIVNGVLLDLSTSIDATNTNVIFVHPESSDLVALDLLRHTAAHVMAQAIKEIFPNAMLAIGPTIENGFYYDIKLERSINPDDFDQIELKMKEIIKRNHVITRKEISKKDAIDLFTKLGEKFKLEIIENLDDENITIYTHDEDKFVDLCKGPHLPRTGYLPNHFKLLKISGAYWRGDSKNESLQRIYATAWFSKEDLDKYVSNLLESEKRDHRKIGKEMDLFHIQEEAVGSIFWHPKGWTLYSTLRNFIRKFLKKDGYLEVSTPSMIDRTLWEASGHWEKFRNNMFIAESENRVLAIKPMNCPGHIQIYKQGTKSYRDLPLKLSEFGNCHRNEPSGSLYGTMRVRSFVQDDGHIFCTLNQISSETKKFCELLTKIYKALGFNTFSVKFSDRPEVRAGTDEGWDLAESLLMQATTDAGLSFSTNKGEGAFYGPKLEFVLKDKLGRDWQCGTLQVDFVLPERLDAWYTAEDGNKKHPVLLHRAILGSLERFIGILLEHYAGKLPLWLTPTQVVVSTITNEFDSYAQEVFELLIDNDIRAEIDLRAEKISYKIREHVSSKVPLMFIVGKTEAENRSVTLRFADGNQEILPLGSAAARIKQMCEQMI